MIDTKEIFGSMVFSDRVMNERLPKDIYKSLKKTMQSGKPLDISLANVVATVMKEWAIEKGATHYTHWFQPMTGVAAEKHEAFISPIGDGTIILEFSGKELIKGEPDASSFPSGGIRATFEARGYTAWDPSSHAFIKDNTLCIPTVFCAYGGESLDKKTPLLRSMALIDVHARRILKLFGNDAKHVSTTLGAEQEYFLIDKEVYLKRKDLIYTGRTLFGAMPPKGQDLEDHYYGSINPRVKSFMSELDNELWKLGIYAKTEHNEAAPGQHELAPIFATSNIAADQNQLTMEIMRRTARKHGLVCLLHEKPFEGVNGSGKHNNWSLCTDNGTNLLEPGDSPAENAQFLLFLTAMIKSVDDYQDLLRISVASAGNDCRLGGYEAPPAVVSLFIGDDLENILTAMVEKKVYNGSGKDEIEVGVDILPRFPKDTTDRNRTSPFAFTGNKFEFRMPGSSLSVAEPNIIINTIFAETLARFADRLEKAEDFTDELNRLIRHRIRDHKRIIFNGNSYSEEWLEEAKSRGLSNLPSTADALPRFLDEKNVELLTKHGIFTEKELRSRYEIYHSAYAKTVNIEALTLCQLVKKDILPAVSKFAAQLSKNAAEVKVLFNADMPYEKETVHRLLKLGENIYDENKNLESALSDVKKITESGELSHFYRDSVLKSMNTLRSHINEAESLIPPEIWPFPCYGDLLYSVN